MVNYGTIYTLPFKSRKEVSYLIEIQKENYEGKSTDVKIKNSMGRLVQNWSVVEILLFP